MFEIDFARDVAADLVGADIRTLNGRLVARSRPPTPFYFAENIRPLPTGVKVEKA